MTVQSCEANPHLPLHLCTVLGFGQQTQSAHYVITYLSYEIQLITTIACVWSSLALPEYSAKCLPKTLIKKIISAQVYILEILPIFDKLSVIYGDFFWPIFWWNQVCRYSMKI